LCRKSNSNLGINPLKKANQATRTLLILVATAIGALVISPIVHADISLHFIHQKSSVNTPADGVRVYAGFEVRKDNNAHIAISNSIQPGTDRWGYLSSWIFASEPAGNYAIETSCKGIGKIDKASVYVKSNRYDLVTIPDDSVVTLTAECRLTLKDNYAQMEPVIVHLSFAPK
jgi:hypothetical protein